MFMDLDEFVYYPDKRPGRLSHWIDRVATHPMVGQVLIDRFNFGLQRSNTASTANASSAPTASAAAAASETVLERFVFRDRHAFHGW
jgi:hypothetical protein